MTGPTSLEVREWLDKQIQAKKLMNEELLVEKHEYVDDKLRCYSATKDIHIGGESVRYIAEKLDLPLCVRARKRDEENPYEVFKIYEDEVFFGIETEEEYKARGAVV